MKNILFKSLAALTAAVIPASALFADFPEKNVAQVEFRSVPADFENLPGREPEKWNFTFRPYGAEAAADLWSDPSVIRNATAGDDMDAKHLPTGVYVCCDEYGFNILVYGASVKRGIKFDAVRGECFFIPGDNDNHKIINYQPFGFRNDHFQYKLSWMKQDRSNRVIFDEMSFDFHHCANGGVAVIKVPWYLYWDKLPIFFDKKDNFWRLSMIRWGGSHGAETWGGVVHSQTKCGYLRMPAFTDAQASLILKTTLLKLWDQFNQEAGSTAISATRFGSSMNAYRRSIAYLPHTWANICEDDQFRPLLNDLYNSRKQIGVEMDKFDTMSLAEQKAFYLKNAPLLANYRYDVESAYATFLKDKMLNRGGKDVKK